MAAAVTWTKDTVSQSPKTIYTASSEAGLMKKVVHDPDAEYGYEWLVVYEQLDPANDTKAWVEEAMGV